MKKKITKKEKQRMLGIVFFSIGGVFLFSALENLINSISPIAKVILAVMIMFGGAYFFDLL